MPREGPKRELRSSPGVIEISLPETPTSGYLWQVGGLPPEIEEISKEFRVRPGQAGYVGAEGTRVFRIRANKPGRYELEFFLQRPWENQPLEHQVISLIVNEGDDHQP